MTRTSGRTRAAKATTITNKPAPVEPVPTPTLPPESMVVRRPKPGPSRILPRTRPLGTDPPPKVVAPTAEEALPGIEFAVGEIAVHPSHGVGRVAAIEEKSLGGSLATVLVLDILGTGLKVLIPKHTAGRVGLRRVMAREDAEAILTTFRSTEVAVNIQPWNRRFRAYSDMMATGSPLEIAKVFRDMQRLKFEKELSFGERRLLEQARGLLVTELGLALGRDREAVEALLVEIFGAGS